MAKNLTTKTLWAIFKFIYARTSLSQGPNLYPTNWFPTGLWLEDGSVTSRGCGANLLLSVDPPLPRVVVTISLWLTHRGVLRTEGQERKRARGLLCPWRYAHTYTHTHTHTRTHTHTHTHIHIHIHIHTHTYIHIHTRIQTQAHTGILIG